MGTVTRPGTARRRAAALAVILVAGGCRENAGPASDVLAVDAIDVAAVSMVAVRLRWAPVDDPDVISYRIERRANFAGSFTVVAPNVPQSTDVEVVYFDIGLEPDTYYGYRVIAQSRFGDRALPSLVRGAHTPPRPAVLVTTNSILNTPAAGDADGYLAFVRGGNDSASVPLGARGEARFGPLTPGPYAVELRGVATQCSVDGAPQRSALVTDQGVHTVDTIAYVVSCRDPGLGRLTVVVDVTGDSLDASGYGLQIVGRPTAPDPADSIVSLHAHLDSLGGLRTFDALKPGPYDVTVDSIAGNCTLTGSAVRTVAVAPLSDDTVRYAIACQGSGGDGGGGPYVWRNTWSASTVQPGQTVQLDISLDLSADAAARVSAAEAELRFDPTVLRYDSTSERSLGRPTVNGATAGLLLWNTFTLGAPPGGLVQLLRVHFTAVGTAGSRAITRSHLGVVADANFEQLSDTLFHVVEDTVSVTTGGSNQPPHADAGGPYAGAAGSAIAFMGSGSSDPDGTIASYSWAFGDGGSATGVAPSHVYSAAGTYTATLTVTDNQGATASDQATVTVTGTGPTTPFTWAGSFGAINPQDSVVALTLTLDLTTDIVDTPGPEELATFVVDSLKWNPAVLRFHAFNWGPGGAGVTNPTDAITQGKLLFGSFPGVRSGLITLATIRFKVIGPHSSSTTTATALGPLTGTAATGTYAYRARTRVQEATLVVP